MEIVNHRRKMLHAIESNAKGNDSFAIKVISAVNIDGKIYISLKKYGWNKKKESNLFIPFSNLLSWTTSLKVTFSGIVLYL